MKPFLVGEPSIFRREWTTRKGTQKSCYVVRWRIGLKNEARRTQTRDKGGFRTKEDARRFFYDHVLPAIDAGHASPDEQEAAIREEAREQEANRKSVGDYFEALIESKPIHLREETYDNYQPVYRLAIDVFGRETLLDAITVESVERLLGYPTPRGKSPSPDTIRRRYLVLRESLEKAIARGFLTANPCAGIKIPKPGKGRLRYLDETECKGLLDACLVIERRGINEPSGIWLHTLVMAALYTGGRQDELLHLEWTDISEPLKQVCIQSKPALGWKTKSGKSRPLGVNPALLAALRHHREARQRELEQALGELRELLDWATADADVRRSLSKPKVLARYSSPPGIQKLIENARGIVRSLELQVASSLVFPNPWGEVREEIPRAYWDVLEATGLKKTGVNFHTLRHTYASHLAQRGVDLPTLKELMGHLSIVTTMRYAHLCPNHASQKGALMPSFSHEEVRQEAPLVRPGGATGRGRSAANDPQ